MTDIASDAAAAPPPAQATTELPAVVVAELLRQQYREPDRLTTLGQPLNIGAVQARLVEMDGGPGLLIMGTNEHGDWHLANFRWWPMPHTFGMETRTYHRGFWRHAAVVYAFAKGWLAAGKEIGFVAGHSLGAGAAQIVGPSLRLTTFAFASPKPLWSGGQPAAHDLVTNWCGKGDIVCKVPPVGFSHVGKVIWLDLKVHSIEAYKDAVHGLPNA